MSSEKESRIGGTLAPESIKIIAESCGISGLADEAASFLADDITYRLKHIVQEGEKIRQHSKRRKLMCSDFDTALQTSNIEPVFGHNTAETTLPFRHASGGGREIFFTDEKEVDLQSVVSEPVAKVPVDISLKAHWLCIDGEQPSLPENPPPINKEAQKQEMLDTSLKTAATKAHKKAEGGKHHKHHHKHKDIVKLKNLTTHELSVEQQFYYKEITESCVGPDELKRSEALQSLQLDPGLHQMLPRFVAFATEGVKINVVQNNLALLIYLMRMVKSLLDNQNIYLDKYLHDLLPTVMTCVVSRQLCLRPDMDNHWALRDFAARLVAQICRNYSNNTNNIQARVTKKFSKAIQCEKAALATQYGAIAGLGELGPEVIKSCLLPYICILGERIKVANEGSALNSIDKVAAEHIKKQLMKYLPNVLKSFHDSSELVDEFNVAYGYLGPLMYSMFVQKEKSLSVPSSVVHSVVSSRPSLSIPQRQTQIVIQQQTSSPAPPPSSPFLSSVPPLSALPPSRPLSALPPSTPGTPSIAPAQKFVIVTQSRPAQATPAAPLPTSPVVKLVTSQQSAPGGPAIPSTPPSAGGAQKFVVIQGSKPPPPPSGDSSSISIGPPGNSSGNNNPPPSLLTTITGKETL